MPSVRYPNSNANFEMHPTHLAPVIAQLPQHLTAAAACPPQQAGPQAIHGCHAAECEGVQQPHARMQRWLPVRYGWGGCVQLRDM